MNREELKARLFDPGTGPEWGIVLGTGFDVWLERISPGRKVEFGEVDGLRDTTALGHGGFFTAGRVEGITVVVAAGRFHLYEGLSVHQVVEPVQLLRSMGVRSVLLTAAVGSIREEIRPGEGLVIMDQINLTGDDPHTGTGRFPDVSALYDPGYVEQLAQAGLRKGVLAGVRGPSYETPAEVNALKFLGADVVCMSTVLEALALAETGVKCAAVVVAANRAGAPGLSHGEVLDSGRFSAEQLWPVVSAFIGSEAGSGPFPRDPEARRP